MSGLKVRVQSFDYKRTSVLQRPAPFPKFPAADVRHAWKLY